MEVKGILNKIESDAREAASAQLADAEKRVAAIRAQCDEQTRQQQEAMNARLKADCAEMEARMLRMAELEDKKSQLQVKRQVMDAAFDKALSQLLALSKAKKRTFFLEELLAAAKGDETVLIGENQADWFDDSFLEDANAALSKAGKTAALQQGMSIPGCGFELRRGGEALNCTFEALVSGSRMALEGDVAKELFPN